MIGIDNPEKYNDIHEDGTIFNLTKENSILELSKNEKSTVWNAMEYKK